VAFELFRARAVSAELGDDGSGVRQRGASKAVFQTPGQPLAVRPAVEQILRERVAAVHLFVDLRDLLEELPQMGPQIDVDLREVGPVLGRREDRSGGRRPRDSPVGFPVFGEADQLVREHGFVIQNGAAGDIDRNRRCSPKP